MADRTRVSVHLVEKAGGTGPHIGTGVLVSPRLVLADARVGEHVAMHGGDPPLRVALASAAHLEIFDVDNVHTGHGLVALELDGLSWCPPDDLDLPDGTSQDTDDHAAAPDEAEDADEDADEVTQLGREQLVTTSTAHVTEHLDVAQGPPAAALTGAGGPDGPDEPDGPDGGGPPYDPRWDPDYPGDPGSPWCKFLGWGCKKKRSSLSGIGGATFEPD